MSEKETLDGHAQGLISKTIQKYKKGQTMIKNKLKVLDLFAGCGGLSKGFEAAGFEVVAANEFWEPAQNTYKKNHPTTRFFPGDITVPETKAEIFDFFKNTQCDVIVGGPPCQAYSNAGLRNPDDPRGKLFEDYVDIVRNLRPKIFVMENVKGILTMMHDKDKLSKCEKDVLTRLKKIEEEKNALLLLRKQSKNNEAKYKFGSIETARLEYLKHKLSLLKSKQISFREKVTNKIVKRFAEIGYKVEFKMLNAADYGVPQKRQRVIFIGTRFDIPILFPEMTHSETQQRTIDGKKLKSWVTVRQAIDDLKYKKEDIAFNHIMTAHNPEFKMKLMKTPIGKSVFGDYSDAFFRNPPDQPSRTVKENHGGVLVHYEQDRVMTPRELARLQSFSDKFIFEGTKSTILKQIGNAVPPLLGKSIGSSVIIMLEKIDQLNHLKASLHSSRIERTSNSSIGIKTGT